MPHQAKGGQRHHAYVVAGESGAGVKLARATIEHELGLKLEANPDVITLTHGLLTVDDARKIISLAHQAALGGDEKAIIIVAARIYHEAQNALLKLFEEPPKGTTLFLIIPELGQLLPTLRSRVAVLQVPAAKKNVVSPAAEAFVKMSKEKRTAYIKKLTSGTDDEERRELRDEALALVNGIEALAYATWGGKRETTALLSDIATLRGYLYDRSAPLKMILEHISLVLPKHLI